MRKQSGITLLALIITIIVILIIASISVYEGIEIIKDAKIQTIETNMLTIKAKAKAYGEEIEASIWALSDTEKTDKKNELVVTYGMSSTSISDEILNQLDSEVSSDYDAYEISELLSNNGLSDLQGNESDGEYIIIYNSSDYTQVDIAYTSGIIYEDIKYYTLSALQTAYSAESES